MSQKTRAYQSFWLNLKFEAGFFFEALRIGLLLQIALFVGLYFYLANFPPNLLNPFAFFMYGVKIDFFKSLEMTPELQFHMTNFANHVVQNGKMPFFWSFGAWIVPIVMLKFFGKKAAEKEKEAILEGSKIIEAQELSKQTKQFKTDLKVGGLVDRTYHILEEEDKFCLKQDKVKELIYRKTTIEIPIKNEVNHFLVLGSSGSGKTTLLKPLLFQFKERGDRMIVHDSKGDLTEMFFKPGDIVLNPYMSGGIKWSIMNEISNIHDIENIVDVFASRINAQSSSNDNFFMQAGKNLVKATFRYLFLERRTTNRDIWDFFLQSELQIIECLNRYEETRFYVSSIAGENKKRASDVYECAKSVIHSLEIMKESDGDFCVADWIKKGKGTVFVHNHKKYNALISPLISLFFDVATRELLSQQERKDRTVFFLDEFSAIGKLESIVDLLKEGRSKGAVVVIGEQEPSSIEEKYGKKTPSILGNAQNMFIFKTNEPKDAEYLSNFVGQALIEQENTSINHKLDGQNMNTMHVQKVQQIRGAIMPSQIQRLRERECLIRLNNFDWSQIKVYPKKYKK